MFHGLWGFALPVYSLHHSPFPFTSVINPNEKDIWWSKWIQLAEHEWIQTSELPVTSVFSWILMRSIPGAQVWCLWEAHSHLSSFSSELCNSLLSSQWQQWSLLRVEPCFLESLLSILIIQNVFHLFEVRLWGTYSIPSGSTESSKAIPFCGVGGWGGGGVSSVRLSKSNFFGLCFHYLSWERRCHHSPPRRPGLCSDLKMKLFYILLRGSRRWPAGSPFIGSKRTWCYSFFV